MDPLKRPSNRPTIKPAINPDPNILYLDSQHDENIASLFKALVKDAYDVLKDIAPAEKKRILAKDVCNADEDVAPVGKKRTWKKVALLSDRDVAPAGKKITQEKEKVRPKKKMRPREKRRCIKKTFSMVGSEIHETKSDNEEWLGSEVSNADVLVRPAFRLSNTSSRAKLGSGNGEVKELGNESIVIICVALIDPLCVSSYFSTSLEMVNAMTLKLPNVYLSVDFENIL